MSTTKIGEKNEQLARCYLEQKGLRYVESNFRSTRGEIDLIMHDSDILVFVEVRFRRNINFGSPAETVTRTKQQRLIYCAEYYCQTMGLDPVSRFDVVSIDNAQSKINIEWIPDAFQVSCNF